MGHRGTSAIAGAIFIALAVLIGGCTPTRQISYSFPPPHSAEDAGLPAYGLTDTADTIAASLLADPKLNAGKRSWTLAVAAMNDHTAGKSFGHSYDVLLDRLRETLFEKSNGRVQLIKRRAAAHGSEEAGASGPAAPPPDVQPDYVIWGEAWDLPSRGANFYRIEFLVNGLNGSAAMLDDDGMEVTAVWKNTCDVHPAHQ